MQNISTTYRNAEFQLIERILQNPDYATKTTYERIDESFTLMNPLENKNNHSNYDYAEEFFRWMMTGETKLSQKLIEINPWVTRFVDSAGLPESFSASYGYKIQEQLDAILTELKDHEESRRAYINILYPGDKIILSAKTTHEFPCTVGAQFFIREDRLHMIVNMRSNNVYKVMPYDVYNFTRLQAHVAGLLNVDLGYYTHQINNAHIYKGDYRRLKEQLL